VFFFLKKSQLSIQKGRKPETTPLCARMCPYPLYEPIDFGLS